MTVLAAIGFVSLAVAAGETYAWPLDLPRVLTSSFAEYRVGRFHMGIDLRTGPPGKDVHAAADGYVTRIRCSPYGYGKAIYLKLNDGNTVVYAHLDDFVPKLRDYVRAAQHKHKRYTVDLYPEAGAFPVVRGDRIAKSGQSGTGAPHLHYEIRDPSGRTINPRRLAITWPDSTRPQIRKVLIAPGSPDSVVNGDLLPVVLDVRRSEDGHYRSDPVRVSGPVGFGIDVIDPANGGSTRLGIHSVRTAAGEKPIFHLRHETLSYESVQDGTVAYHPFLLHEGRFLLQWRWPGNDSHAYRQTASEGWFDPRGQSTDVIITVEDFMENTATLTIPLRPHQTEAPGASVQGAAGTGAAGTGAVEIDCFGNWLVITARFDQNEELIPVLEHKSTPIQGTPFRRVGAAVFRAAYAPAPGTREAVLRVAHPRIEDRALHFAVVQRGEAQREIRLGGLRIGTKPNAPYGTLFVQVNESQASPTPTLKPVGKAYEVWPPRAPIDEALTLSFPFPDGAVDPSRLLVYRQTPKGWEAVPTARRNGRLEIATRRLGTFAVLEDVAAPAIRILTPRPRTDLPTARPSIRAVINDAGSGVAEFSATCNGRWLLMEYDPERSLLVWAEDEDLPAGPSDLTVHVRDAAGNSATEVLRLNVPGTAGDLS